MKYSATPIFSLKLVKVRGETVAEVSKLQSNRCNYRPVTNYLSIYLSIYLSDGYCLRIARRRQKYKPPPPPLPLVGTRATKATTERVASPHTPTCMLPLPLLLVRDLGGPYLSDRDLEQGLEETTKTIANIE